MMIKKRKRAFAMAVIQAKRNKVGYRNMVRTPSQVLIWLKNNQVYGKLKREWSSYNKTLPAIAFDTWLSTCGDLEHMILYAFPWMPTEDGFEYWNRIDVLYRQWYKDID